MASDRQPSDQSATTEQAGSAPAQEQGNPSPKQIRLDKWREITAVVLMSITAIATAWSGFQVVKWGGAMAIAFSQAGGERLSAARSDNDANRQLTLQVQVYTSWVTAKAEGKTELADYISDRFTEPLRSAWLAWMALDPENTAGTPGTPFDMPEYVQPDSLLAQEADDRAEALFRQALVNNQRGDNYALLTVIFASVLFFAGISLRMKSTVNAWIMLGAGIVLFLLATTLIATFPKLL